MENPPAITLAAEFSRPRRSRQEASGWFRIGLEFWNGTRPLTIRNTSVPSLTVAWPGEA